GERVVLNADELQALPLRSAGRQLVAALQTRDQDGGCFGREGRHGDSRRLCYVTPRGRRAGTKRGDRGGPGEGGADAARQAPFRAAGHGAVLPDLRPTLVRGPRGITSVSRPEPIQKHARKLIAAR